MSSDTRQTEKKSNSVRRSRHGCRNCKLRRLKCDETRPHCTKCRLYGVRCNFAFNVSDLQPLNEEQARRETAGTRSGLLSPQLPVNNGIWYSNGSTCVTLDSQDQALFNRFRYRTLYSLSGSAMAEIYENHMLTACFAAPFLMHGTLAVAAAHDRYLGPTPHRRTLRETYHFSQCTTLFNRWLGHSIAEAHKDPLWATAGALAILTFSSINTCFPSEAWPLGTPDSSDLEWLSLGAGKMALWHLVNPLRQESAFRMIYDMPVRMHKCLPTKGTVGVSVELAELCGLCESSTPENSPYFTVVHHISRLLEIPKGAATEDGIMMVAGHMHGQFATCLKKKDPVALLLLCLWYTRASESKWWIKIRARYELPAICIYLRRHHGDNSAIQALIPWADLDGPG
ncbi:hypothetical protein BDW59DRAFT_154429 [Aspergillus cavernicola]|uniref:Zn(2)-C6 fungal-type domain-containing protein n=1 Tax=Aspergillus cavernicola TaxID=176166 RepID=A0ABR4HGQ0_9EURO